MIRAKAIAIIVSKANGTCVFQNLQRNGLRTPHSLADECFTLTSAMGLGGADTSNSKSI